MTGQADPPWRRPPALGPGATVGIIAPSGPVDPGHLEAGLARLRQAGLVPQLAPGIFSRAHYLAGPDPVRLAGCQALFDDPTVDAILCARGGYGALRLLPGLNLRGLIARRQALVGFSDITALHLALGRARVVSFHGPVVSCAPEPDPAEAEALDANFAALVAALCGAGPPGPLALPSAGPAPVALAPGRATGRLVGGSLSLIAATLGTPWQIDTAGRILLLEDVGEAPYRLDRLLTQLALAGTLAVAAGFVIGELVGCEAPGGGGPAPLEVLAERLVPLGRPVIANLPLGHGRFRQTLPLGVLAEIDAAGPTLRLLEPALD